MLLNKTEAPTLTDLEWQVVKVAIADAAKPRLTAPTTGGTSRFARFYAWATGTKLLAPLADPRLEALRRFVFVSRRTRRLAEAQIPALLEFGFSRAQVTALATLSV